MSETTTYYAPSHDENAEALSEVLQRDLELAFTMLQAAKITSNPEHYQAALAKIRRALQSVRDFESRIQDPALWTTIHNLADELERTLAIPKVAVLVLAA